MVEKCQKGKITAKSSQSNLFICVIGKCIMLPGLLSLRSKSSQGEEEGKERGRGRGESGGGEGQGKGERETSNSIPLVGYFSI